VYPRPLDERRSLDSAAVTPVVTERAIELQHELARPAQSRLPIPDLLISARALVAGLVVLHYESDFERIAEAGGAAQEWVVPKGSI
jgi:predicted nucleic acid-binding protein